VTPLHYSGRRATTPPRASDGDAWLVYAALLPYAVPVETVVRKPVERPLPFGMLRRVGALERLDARRQAREQRNA
jgi:hypothetical protein